MILDSVIGFNETDLFLIRYKELSFYVNRFLIVEATHTHSGIPKPLYFSDMKDRDDCGVDWTRVDIIVWDNGGMPADNAHAWIRENYQREIIGKYVLEHCAPNDVIMLSDMDEIPSASSLRNFIEHVERVSITDRFSGVWRFEQDLSYLYFNTTSGKWCGTKIFPAHMLTALHSDKPMTDLIRYRPEHLIAGTIANGGWHFSSVGGVDNMREKMVSYAHTEQAALRSVEDITDSIKRLVNPFDKSPLTVRDIEFLPIYVQNNHERFAKYLYRTNS